jgi:hypothetical protein
MIRRGKRTDLVSNQVQSEFLLTFERGLTIRSSAKFSAVQWDFPPFFELVKLIIIKML